MQSSPKPILQAVIARKTMLRIWASEPAAAVIAVKVKPEIYHKAKALPVSKEEFVVIVLNVVIQYCNSMSLIGYADYTTYLRWAMLCCRVVSVVFLNAANINNFKFRHFKVI